MKVILDEQILLYVLAALGLISMVIKLMTNRCYERMLTASDKMGHTEHDLMKEIQMKYEACVATRSSMKNVDIFVDKYVYHYRKCGAYLYTWENVSLQLFIFSMVLCICGCFAAILSEAGRNVVLSTLVAGIALLGMWIFLDGMLNVSMKKEMIHINIMHYLDNICGPRLEKQIAIGGTPDSILEAKDIQLEFTREEEKVIEEVLKEYI